MYSVFECGTNMNEQENSGKQKRQMNKWDRISPTSSRTLKIISGNDFTINQLGISGLELLLFSALVNYPGYVLSTPDVMFLLGKSRQTCYKVLKKLEDKKLIVRKNYKINKELIRTVLTCTVKLDGTTKGKSTIQQELANARHHLLSYYRQIKTGYIDEINDSINSNVSNSYFEGGIEF